MRFTDVADTGKPVITPQNAVDFSRLLADVIETDM